MELPDEIVDIIREFSKPVFPYRNDYRIAMNSMGRNDWPLLKMKMCSDEHVLVLLKAYNNEAILKKETDDKLESAYWHQEYTTPMIQWKERNKLMNLSRQSYHTKTKLYKELVDTVGV